MFILCADFCWNHRQYTVTKTSIAVTKNFNVITIFIVVVFFKNLL